MIFFFCVFTSIYGCSKKPSAQASNKAQILQVVVSGYAPYSIAKEVLKDIADISILIPPGADAHHFEPLPSTIAEIQKADYFFYISDKMEPWALKISNGSGLALAVNLPNLNPKDPHVWIDFANTYKMAENIASVVVVKHPEFEDKLAKNLGVFSGELKMLDRLYSKIFTNCQSRDIYHIGHMAFGYMAKKYNLNFRPLIGATFGAEPSAKNMATMIKEIKNKHLSYIFTEEALNSKIAATIAAESNAKTLNLYTIEQATKDEFEQNISYKQFMMMNLENLTKGLGCGE
ncbi:MAG: zinc ABC transporter substrate-binding protein [Elusimicrobiota bacterium]|nr:zinc ABC transporter substrate-binding protein [Elusimicrobiota bacterium]